MNKTKRMDARAVVNTAMDRALPWSEYDEHGVLAESFYCRRCFLEASAIIGPEDFLDEENADLFRIITRIYAETGAPPPANALLSAVGPKAPTSLVNLVRRLHNGEFGKLGWHGKYHALQVKKHAIRREAIFMAADFVTIAESVDPRTTAADFLATLKERFDQISALDTNGHVCGPKDLADDVFDRILTDAPDDDGLVLSFPFHELDRHFNGMRRGELIVISGGTSMGKTALAMNIADHVANELRQPVLYVSLEMNRNEINERLVSARSMVPLQTLQRKTFTRSQRESIENAGRELRLGAFQVDDTPNQTIASMQAHALRQMDSTGLGLVVVDHMHLVKTSKEKTSSYERMTEISDQLKGMAMELDRPVIALAQVSREGMKTTNGKPELHHLRDSGAIEQNANKALRVWFDTKADISVTGSVPAEVYISKNRSGPRDVEIPMWYYPRTVTFLEAAPEKDSILEAHNLEN